MDFLWYQNTLYKDLKTLWEQGEEYYNKFLNVDANSDFKSWLSRIFATCGLELNYSGPNDNNVEVGNNNDRYIRFLCIGVFTITAPKDCIALKFKSSDGISVKQLLINTDGYFTIAESLQWNSITLYFDDVALGMDINKGYLYKNTIESNRINVSNASIFKNEHSSDINLNNYVVQTFQNRWNSFITPPNYGLSGKNIQGVLSKNPQLAPTTPDGSAIETYQYSEKYNNKEKPYFWDLQDCRCFVCYSNFGGSDLWGQDGNIETSGLSEQPYSIDDKIGRDKVYETDSTNNWMHKEYYLGISSDDQDSESSGQANIDANGKTYYSWYQMKEYSNQKKNIKTFTPGNRLTIKLEVLNKKKSITVSTGNGTTNTYNLELFDSVLIAKRDLISLQKAFDDNNMMKHVLFYVSNQPNESYEYINIVPTKYVPWNFIGINHTENKTHWEWTSGVEKNNNNGYLITDSNIWGYFDFDANTPVNSWEDLIFVEHKPESVEPVIESLTVTLPDIEYYNITSLLERQRELIFPRDMDYLTDDLIIIPKFKNNIEHKASPQEYKWTFSMDVPDSFYDNFNINYHNDICYELTVDNVMLINETVPGAVDSLRKWNTKTFNFEGYYPRPETYPSSLSTAILIQDYIQVSGMPNWFEDFFVDVGSSMMGVSGYDSTIIQEFKLMSTGYETTIHTNDDTWNSNFYCEAGVFGWSEWIDKYTNIIPASTSLSNIGSANWKENLTYYASQISYLWYGNHESWPYTWTARGIQAGLTTGILINYPDIDQVDTQSFKIPKNTMPSMAVIICDSYNLT